jgi:hypothetical protein
MITLIDQDIAHISRVMTPSFCGDFGGPILPDAHHVTKTQLCSIDDLLLQLDELDAAILHGKAVAET